jgi:hypothetical protein
MASHVKWGLIVGGGAALLSLCGGAAIGIYNACCFALFVIGGAALAGYLTVKDDNSASRMQNGAIAGAVVGGLGTVGQTLGGMIGTLVGASIYALVPEAAQNAPFGDPTTTGILGIGINVGAGVCVGLLLTAVAAGVGALMGRMVNPDSAPPATM